MFERSRLDRTIPRTTLPIIFLAIGADPRRQRHEKPAPERVHIRFVEETKFGETFVRVRTVILISAENHAVLGKFRSERG